MKKTKKATATKKTAPAARARKTASAKPVPTFYKHYAYPKGRSLPVGGDAMGGDLAAAAQGPDAVLRLRRFVKKYEPSDDEYQDGFHRNRVRAAKYELMRLEYIKGNIKAGDLLLAQLQDLDG